MMLKDKNREKERALILSDAVVCNALEIEAQAVGVTLGEYVDRFLELFYKSPLMFYSVLNEFGRES